MATDTTHPGQGCPTLLTAAEAAVILRKQVGTVREHTRRGIIPCVRFGRQVLYDEADLHAFIESAKQPTRPVADDDRRGVLTPNVRNS